MFHVKQPKYTAFNLSKRFQKNVSRETFFFVSATFHVKHMNKERNILLSLRLILHFLIGCGIIIAV